jgi:hypothetical protein
MLDEEQRYRAEQAAAHTADQEKVGADRDRALR